MKKLNKLNASQKLTLILLVVLVAVVALVTLLSPKTRDRKSRAAAAVALPPTPPTPPSIMFVNSGATNNSYVQTTLKTIFAGNPFTVEAWINFPKNTPSGNTALQEFTLAHLSKAPGVYDQGYIFRLSLEVSPQDGTGRPMFYVLTNGTNPVSSNYASIGALNTTILQPDTWNHVAVTSYSEGGMCKLNLFVNGKLADNSGRTNGVDQNCKINAGVPLNFYLAKPPSYLTSSLYYNGILDDFRISKGVRYDSGFFPLPSTTDLLYTFNNQSGGDYLIRDSSGNGNDGTAYGTFQFVDLLSTPTPTPTTVIFPSFTPTPTPTLGILKNSSFEIDVNKDNLPDFWTPSNLSVNDGLDKTKVYDLAYSFKFAPLAATGPAPAKQIFQTIKLSGVADQAVRLDVFNQTDLTIKNGYVGAILTVQYADGQIDQTSVKFPLTAHSWTKKSLILVTDRPYYSVQVSLVNTNKNTNARFDKLNLAITSSAASQGLKSTPSELTKTELNSYR